MTIGACVDAGLSIDVLKEQLALLHLHGYELSAEKVKRAGIAGTKVHVVISQEDAHTQSRHAHHHHHSRFTFSDIQSLIEESNLHQDIKESSIKVFHRLAQAEAKVHNTSVEEVHFHAVGAVDSIVDIVGSVIAMKHLGIEKIYFSPIPTGHGYTKCEHGTFPVPAPATAELLKTHLTKYVDVAKELTTPTGAAIVTALGEGLRTIPEMRVLQVGYGAGSNDNPAVPNLLRVFIGETVLTPESDEMWVVETNIDNISGEILGYTMDKLFESGAADVYFAAIQMKKGRPGTMVSVIVSDINVTAVESVLFEQTTTFGIRKYKVMRKTLAREFREVDSRFGKIKVKIGRCNGDVKSFSPEYEDCKKIAGEKGIPLKQVYSAVSNEFLKKHD